MLLGSFSRLARLRRHGIALRLALGQPRASAHAVALRPLRRTLRAGVVVGCWIAWPLAGFAAAIFQLGRGATPLLILGASAAVLSVASLVARVTTRRARIDATDLLRTP